MFNNNQITNSNFSDRNQNLLCSKIAVVKVQNNHYAILTIEANDSYQHVYIYKATEEAGENGTYSYSWDYSSPTCVSFKYEDYLTGCPNSKDEKEIEEFNKKKSNWVEGKHITDWIINNIK